MNFRLRLAAWSALSILLIVGVLIFSAHWHLDEELRKDRWDRTHPQFPQWSIHGSYTEAEIHDILGELLKVWIWVAGPLVLTSVAVGYLIIPKAAARTALTKKSSLTIRTTEIATTTKIS